MRDEGYRRDEACFFENFRGGSGGTLGRRLVSKEQVAATVKRVMEQHKLKRVFLATDGKDKDLVGWIKKATGATTLDDLPAGWQGGRGHGDGGGRRGKGGFITRRCIHPSAFFHT